MIFEHMTDLASALRKYFPAPDKNSDWMKHPFKKQDVASLTNLSENEQDQLVDLSCNRAWEIIYKEENDLCHFWFLARSAAPQQPGMLGMHETPGPLVKCNNGAQNRMT